MNANPPEWGRYHRAQHHPEIELLQARYTRHTFAPHFHDTCAIGLVEAGALSNAFRQHYPAVLAAGETMLIRAGDVHTGRAVGDNGVAYCMIYLPEDLIATALDSRAVTPRPRQTQTGSPPFARQFAALFRLLSDPGAGLLEQDSLLTVALAELFLPGPQDEPTPKAHPGPHPGIRMAHQYLSANFANLIPLAQLGALANLSSYHFLRVFQEQIGLTPHAYQTQLRIEQAKALIRAGTELAQIGCQVGYYDQSHFTKAFKSLVGVTPGQYRAQV